MKVMHGAVLLAMFSLSLAACGDKQEAAPAAPDESPGAEPAAPDESPGAEPAVAAPSAAEATPPARADRVVPASFSREAVTPEMKHTGKIVGGLRWSDVSGDNVVIFSVATRRGKDEWDNEVESAQLYAYHYVRDGAETRLLRTIRDRVDDCEFDLFASFRDDAFGVTDLDGDGVGEVTFAYEVECVSDVSPRTLKLLLLEGGDKYIIRGTTRVGPPGDTEGGDRTIDRSLTQGPRVFLDHATRTWDAIAGAR